MSSANGPVFVSYSSRDQPWADKIIEFLEQDGIRCWYAPRDITAGAEWGSAIIDGIHQCRVMIVVFSEHSNQSSHVRREVERAISKSIPILPIRIDECQPTGALDYALSNTHWLDAFVPPIEQRLRQMADAIRGILGHDTAPRLVVSEDTDSRIESTRPESRSIGTTRRKTLVLGGALLGASVPIGLAIALRNPNSEVDSDPEKDDSDSKFLSKVDEQGVLFEDKTLDFQGRWRVVREYGLRGFYSRQAVEDRRNTWNFLGHQLNTTRKPTMNSRAGVRGTVHLRSTANQSHFDFFGRDSDGHLQRWVGIHELTDGRLRVSFRPRMPGMTGPPPRPESLSVSDEPNVMYFELVRQ
jgi:uncharacterized protein (TIGR03067 family)